jgi:hypothetical protein
VKSPRRYLVRAWSSRFASTRSVEAVGVAMGVPVH